MQSTTQAHTDAETRMKSVKSAWDRAPSGSKKDQAQTHYAAAETAFKANKDADCVTALDKAEAALK